MKLVIIESPLGTRADGTRCTPEEFERNQRYADACMLDSLRRGEAPYGSHIIYPRVLKDALPEERRLGMDAGFAWGRCAALVAKDYRVAQTYCYSPPMLEKMDQAIVAVYADFGITSGMRDGINRHEANGLPIEYREIPNWESAQPS